MNKQKTLKTILAIVISIAVVVGVAFVVVTLLRQSLPVKSSADEQVQQASRQAILEELTEESVVPGLEAYDRQSQTVASGSVSASLQGKVYRTSIDTDSAVTYFLKDREGSVDFEGLTGQFQSFLQKYGLERTQSTNSSVTFRGDQTICLLSTATAGIPSIGFSCTDTQAVTAEYEAIEQLLALYKRSEVASTVPIPEFNQATRTVRARNDFSSAVLSLTPDIPSEANSGIVLLFAARGNQWEYVANLSEGENDGKQRLTPEARDAIAYPKWNGFLEEQF